MAPSPETTVVEPREGPRDIETKPIPANRPATAASIPPSGVTVSEAPDEKTNPTARAVATRYESAAAVSGSTESEAAFATSVPNGPRNGACELVKCRGTPTLGRVIPRPALRLFVMANGTVEFFNDTGGYGFISTDDGDLDDDEDVFFHMEDVGGEDLTEGTEVEFDIESSPKGPRAANVVRT